ncbi:unnamed protein product, partial [Musa acuminata subsp. burmannicoides]
RALTTTRHAPIPTVLGPPRLTHQGRPRQANAPADTPHTLRQLGSTRNDHDGDRRHRRYGPALAGWPIRYPLAD